MAKAKKARVTKKQATAAAKVVANLATPSEREERMTKAFEKWEAAARVEKEIKAKGKEKVNGALATMRTAIETGTTDDKSKLSKLSGPLMNSAMVDDFRSLTPGVTSTSTTLRTSSGAWSASAIVVIPPSDMPTTAAASGAKVRTATATSSALAATSTEPWRPPSE